MGDATLSKSAPSVLALDALSDHVAILGRVGTGKTYAAKTLVEGLLDLGRRVLILDPTGVWWGLRSSADGQHPGFPIVVLGGDHADIPIDPSQGVAIAEVIAGGDTPMVLDLSGFSQADKHRFVTALAETLLQLNRRPLHLVIDEADDAIPQNPLPESRRMMGAIDRIIRRGRVLGFRVLLITQRPAVIHKNALSQARTLIVLALGAPQDRKAVEAWIAGQADAELGRQVLASLGRLKRGEGWIWSPDRDVLERVIFPAIRTLDSSRSPEDAASVAPARPQLAHVDVDRIREALAMPATVTASQPGRPARIGVNAEDLTKAREEGYAAGLAEGRRLAADTAAVAFRQIRDRLLETIDAAVTLAIDAIEDIRDDSAGATRAVAAASEPAAAQRSAHAPLPAPKAATAAHGATKPAGGAMRILQVLAQRHPARFSEAQWATLAGLKRTGGTWSTYKSRLRGLGYLEEAGGLFGASPVGLAACGALPPGPQGAAEILAMWRDALGGGPGRLLDLIVAAGPSGIEREELARRADITASGGTFSTYLSKLRSNGLVETQAGGRIAAASILLGPPR